MLTGKVGSLQEHDVNHLVNARLLFLFPLCSAASVMLFCFLLHPADIKCRRKFSVSASMRMSR